MTKKIRLRKGLTIGRDLLKVGAIVNELTKHEFLLDPSETPLQALEKGLSENKPELDLPYLCLESEHRKDKGLVHVRVYDYIRNGDCVIDVKYADKIDSFLKGCHNLALALREYVESSHATVLENLEKD